MSQLRAIWADLRDQRLWPLAAALAVALVAVPVVLSRTAGAPPAPAAPPAAARPASPAPGAAPIRVVDGLPARSPAGRFRDPFAGAQRAASSAGGAGAGAAPRGPAPTTTSAGGSAPAASPAGNATTTTPPSSSGPAVSLKPAAPAAKLPYAAGWHVDVRFGEAGSLRARSDLLRLAPLPSATLPVVVFLGVRDGGRTAAFALPGASGGTGDGRCLPSAADCQVVELRKGDSEFFDVTASDGRVVQYELDLERVAPRRAATAAEADRLRGQASKTGRETMVAMLGGGRDYAAELVYIRRRGVLVHRADLKATILGRAGAQASGQ